LKPIALPSIANMALIAAMIAVLATAGWFTAGSWVAANGPATPAYRYVAMALGAALSSGLGCGLMALLFYSNRHGYDEPPHAGESE
jgi:hypothetical protein